MNDDYFKSEEFREILEAYEQYLENDKSTYLDADDFADVADYYLTCNDPKRAKEAVDGGLAQHPDDEMLLTENVSIKIFEHKYAAARRCLMTHKLEGNDNFYQQAQLTYALDNDIKKSEEMFRQWMEKELAEAEQNDREFTERDAYLHIISSYVELNDDAFNVPDVVEMIKLWIDEYIDKFQPLGRHDIDLQVMDICRHNKLSAQLVRGLTQVLDEQPYLQGGWASLALAHYILDQFDQAIEATDFALAIDTHDVSALLTRAYSHISLGQREEAREYFERYINEPNIETVQYIPYADCLLKTDRKDLANKYIDIGVQALHDEYKGNNFANEEDKTRYIQALYDASNIFQLLERYEEAEDCMQHVVNVDPEDAEAYFMMANMMLAQGKKVDALAIYGVAIGKAKDHVKMGLDVSLTLVMNNIDEVALDVVELVEKRALKEESESPALLHVPAIKAFIHLKLDHTYPFLHYFKQAIENTPDLVKSVFSDYFPEGLDIDDYYDYAVGKLLTQNKE